MDRPVTCLRARTSDRTDGAGAGAEALARALGGTIVGEAEPGVPRDWHADLETSRPVLEAAAAAAAEPAVITASDCTICMGTFPAVVAREPSVRFLWLDAHGDFNTPDTTPSGFLGGMCLSAACGAWTEGRIDPARVHMVGVRDLDEDEREVVARAGVRMGVPHHGPVYVHLDCDVLDPTVHRAQFPVPGGMGLQGLGALLAALGERVVGVEVTALEEPSLAPAIAELLR
ncbi:MAG TPA: arginase family protein [Solirubrobacteraceae bacterium]|nr:arginase family protein [Solirubrobacteraceae bacterium]